MLPGRKRKNEDEASALCVKGSDGLSASSSIFCRDYRAALCFAGVDRKKLNPVFDKGHNKTGERGRE